MSTQDLTFSAGEKKFIGPGNFLRIDSATAAVFIKFKKLDTGIDEEHEAEQGDRFFFEPKDGAFAFDSVEIVSEAAQTITVTTSGGQKGSDKVSGDIGIKPASGLTTYETVIVNAGQKGLIAAANPARKRIHIANMTSTYTVTWGDINVTASRGAPLRPNETIVIENTAAIYVFNTNAGGADFKITEET